MVIVTAKAEASLTKCLASLALQTLSGFDVVVICSGCPTPQESTTRPAERTRFIATANRGYGAACNAGARCSDTPYLVFLNDDTELHPDCLRSLYESLSENENTLLQPTIYHEYAQRIMLGNPCDVYGAAGLGFYGNCGAGRFYASGALLAVSKKVFDRLGGFDEKLFLYYDDVDLSWRARLMGYRVSCVEGAICKHTGGTSSTNMLHPVKFYLTQRNRIRVMIKNYSARRILHRGLIACTLIVTGATFLTVSTRKVRYLTFACKTFAWNLWGLKDTLIERYKVQRKRLHDDAVIERSMSRFSMDLCVFKRRIISV